MVDSTGKLKDMDTLIPELADAFAGMENGVRKSALAQEIFGRTGVELIPSTQSRIGRPRGLRPASGGVGPGHQRRGRKDGRGLEGRPG